MPSLNYQGGDLSASQAEGEALKQKKCKYTVSFSSFCQTCIHNIKYVYQYAKSLAIPIGPMGRSKGKQKEISECGTLFCV